MKRKRFPPLENYLKFNLHTAFYQEHTCGMLKKKKKKKRHTDNISKFGYLKLLSFQDWLICKGSEEHLQMESSFSAVPGPRKFFQEDKAISCRAMSSPNFSTPGLAHPPPPAVPQPSLINQKLNSIHCI